MSNPFKICKSRERCTLWQVEQASSKVHTETTTATENSVAVQPIEKVRN